MLANNSFYTVPFEVSVDPLLECVGMGTDWLHINGTVVSTNDHPATPLYQTYGPDRTQLHKGLTLTALDEGVFICAANSTGNRLLVTLHLPQGIQWVGGWGGCDLSGCGLVGWGEYFVPDVST